MHRLIGVSWSGLYFLKLTERFDCWKILHDFVSSADFFSKLTFSKNSFRNTIRINNFLDPDQGQHFVGPDLVPNCFVLFHWIQQYFSYVGMRPPGLNQY